MSLHPHQHLLLVIQFFLETMVILSEQGCLNKCHENVVRWEHPS